MSNKIDWLIAVERFIMAGDYKSIKGAAREIFTLSKDTPDGFLVMAEGALLTGDLDGANYYLEESKSLLKNVPSGRFSYVAASLESRAFKPVSSVKIVEKFIRETNLLKRKKELISKLDAADKETFVELNVVERLLTIAINDYALLGEANYAKELLALLCELSPLHKAEFYSNYLFFVNYRMMTAGEARRVVGKYTEMLEKRPLRSIGFQSREKTDEIADFFAEKKRGNKLKIGFISGVLKQHATFYFLPALFTPPDDTFEVYVYSRGQEDLYSKKLRELKIHWRNVSALTAEEAAKKISQDNVDILVDLAGHASGSCLDVISYRPAPIVMTAIGYFSSVGHPDIKYILTDKTLTPLGKTERFAEECLTLTKHSALCFTPLERLDLMLKEDYKQPILKSSEPDSMEDVDISRLPSDENGYVTFICIQNLLKVSDDLLQLWKKVFDELKDFRLILQNKTISTPEGKKHLQNRLRKVGIKLSQTELLPFAKDYEKTLTKADIALDTTPYPGGLTTCQTLYRGVPVITLKGNDPWSRLGASILYAAHLEELIAETPTDYAQKMLNLANDPKKRAYYRNTLKERLIASRLMDIKGYSKEVYALFRKIGGKI